MIVWRIPFFNSVIRKNIWLLLLKKLFFSIFSFIRNAPRALHLIIDINVSFSLVTTLETILRDIYSLSCLSTFN